MRDNDKRTITVDVPKCGPYSSFDGSVKITKHNLYGWVDVHVTREGEGTTFRRQTASKSMSADKAIELRDALIELFPPTNAAPTLKSTYEYDTIGGQPAVFETRQQHSTMRYKVAEFATEADARLFIDAKNRATA